MVEKRYKWESPHAWLLDKIQKRRITRAELVSIIDSLAWRLDADAIQDLFQDEMSEDGYFRKVK